MTYIHYGSTAFNPTLFSPIRNKILDLGGFADRHPAPTDDEIRLIDAVRFWPKPHGGLWASRADDPHGWAAWCQDNHFHTDDLCRNFTFSLKPGSRVVSIASLDDIAGLPLQKEWAAKDMSWMDELQPGQIPTLKQLSELYTPNPVYLDFEKMVEQGIDAVEIVDWAAVAEAFPMWDCNSMIVLRAEAVVV